MRACFGPPLNLSYVESRSAIRMPTRRVRRGCIQTDVRQESFGTEPGFQALRLRRNDGANESADNSQLMTVLRGNANKLRSHSLAVLTKRSKSNFRVAWRTSRQSWRPW